MNEENTQIARVPKKGNTQRARCKSKNANLKSIERRTLPFQFAVTQIHGRTTLTSLVLRILGKLLTIRRLEIYGTA